MKFRHPDYPFVDFAKGDVRSRNNVVELGTALDARSNGAMHNSYITVYRFPEAYREHVRAHGSVSGYAGPAYADYLPFDVDRDGDLSAARLATMALAVCLVEVFDLNHDQLRYYFSGAKGYHLLVPTRLMGDVEPSPHLPAAFRTMALSIAELAGVEIDRAIYDVNRLFRLPQTRHPRTNLWKVELSWDELQSGEIMEIARTPRRFDWEPHDLEPRESLSEFYAKHIYEAEQPPAPVRRRGGEGPENVRRLALSLAPAFVQGQRHNLILAFSGYAAKRHLPRETALGVVDWLLDGEPNVEDPDNLPNAVNATYDRVRNGEQVKGYSELSELMAPQDLANVRDLLGDRDRAAPAPERAEAPSRPAPEARVSLANVYDADRAGQAYLEYIRTLTQRRVNLGIPTIDKLTRGLMPGTVMTLLAKARVGKSLFVQAVRRHIAKHTRDGASVFFSLEMPIELVFERDAQYALSRSGRGVEDAMREAEEAEAQRLIAMIARETPRCYTVTTPGLSLEEMAEYCTLIRSTFGHRISAVMIDYLSLVSGSGQDIYTTTSRIARGLKSFAKEIEAPVIVLSQVRRRSADGEKVDGSTPPSLEDGRDSGAIEEGSDFVIGAWRPKIEHEYDDDEIGFKILKNRMGSAGKEVFCRIDWQRLTLTEILPDEHASYEVGR